MCPLRDAAEALQRHKHSRGAASTAFYLSISHRGLTETLALLSEGTVREPLSDLLSMGSHACARTARYIDVHMTHKIRTMFHAFDADGSGSITREVGRCRLTLGSHK